VRLRLWGVRSQRSRSYRHGRHRKAGHQGRGVPWSFPQKSFQGWQASQGRGYSVAV